MAAIRLAVRRALEADGADRAAVAVACSGGADSLALLAATVAETRRGHVRVVGVTVDHALQPGSQARAADVAGQMRELGADEAVVRSVEVTLAGHGVEASARTARYAALDDVARGHGCTRVLLGHTRDDQAETVLLGLARGSGGRSLSGMQEVSGRYRRPLLDISREQTEAACRALGLTPWQDPHNLDESFSRVRVRRRVLPVLERELGPGVAAALARTAAMLQVDVELLDRLADRAYESAAGTGGLDVAVLRESEDALLSRMLRRAALEAGAPASELFRVHVVALAALVATRVGGKRVQLPGHVSAWVEEGVLRFGPTSARGGSPAVGG